MKPEAILTKPEAIVTKPKPKSMKAAQRKLVSATLAFVMAAAVTIVPNASAVKAAERNGFTIATAPYSFVFPRDHSAHPGYQTEWWYYTGHLRAKSGRTFGYELTFFRFGLRPGDPQPASTQSKWRGNEIYPAHFAITDEAGKTFFYDVRFAREALRMGGAASNDLDVRAEDWTLTGSALPGKPAIERMVLHARDVTSAGVDQIDLVQLPEKVPAIHGRGGVSRKSGCISCASHYYSYTRLHTTGTLVFDNQRFAVDGISWMDHEYGSAELQSDQAGWDWFSVQLDDRREIMAYVLRQKDGSITAESAGSLIEPDGTVRYLARDAFTVSSTGTWKSPHTGAVYPSGWHLQVPGAGIDVTLTPTVDDQELAATSGNISYWEGAVNVTGANDAKTLGAGYVELTGYATTISL